MAYDLLCEQLMSSLCTNLCRPRVVNLSTSESEYIVYSFVSLSRLALIMFASCGTQLIRARGLDITPPPK